MKIIMQKIELSIDVISDIMGKIGWLLVIYALIFGITDVALRYLFNMPSLWISITIQYSMVLLACVAGPYALNNEKFVKLDVFYERFSDRTKAIVDILTFFIAFIYLYVLITKGFEAAMNSYSRNEMTPTSIKIPLYHLKFVIPLSAAITMLIVLKKFGIDIATAITGKARPVLDSDEME